MSELQLAKIITTVLTKDDQARHQGEQYLSQLKTEDLDKYVTLFLNLLHNSPQKDIRTYCAFKLRNLFTISGEEARENIEWVLLKPETQKRTKDILVQSLLKERNSGPRKMMCQLTCTLIATISSILGQHSEEGRQWNSFVEEIWSFLSSDNIVLLRDGLKILSVLLKYFYLEFEGLRDQIILIIKQSLEHEDLEVKAYAIEAHIEYLQNIPRDSISHLTNLFPSVLENILIIADKDEDLIQEVLVCLNESISIEPSRVKSHIRPLVETMKIISQRGQPPISFAALEIMVLLVERLPGACNKQQGLLGELFNVIFSTLIPCVIQPDEQWLSPPDEKVQETEEVVSEETPIKFCMSMFDRLIFSSKKTTLPLFASILREIATMDDWRYKYSALMALSQVGEHIPSIDEIDPIVEFTLSFIKDESPKVRYAAFHCIGQLSDDNRFTFQKRYGHVILPVLIEAIKDPVPRVVAHVLAAFTNFLEGCAPEHAREYILEILEPCLGCIDSGIHFVKGNALANIAALAVATVREFTPYWQRTAEVVLNFLRNTNRSELKQLKGQAVECLTLIGNAIGKDEFSKAAKEIIDEMIKAQNSVTEKHDPQTVYLLAGWQRFCTIFGQEFIPYVKEIVPSVLDFMEKSTRNMSEGRSIEEMTVAAKTITGFLSECGEGCLPFILRISEILSRLLESTKNQDIRVIVTQGLPRIISILKATQDGEKEAIILSNSFIKLLWKLTMGEFDNLLIKMCIVAMTAIIDSAGSFMDKIGVRTMHGHIIFTVQESDRRKQGIAILRDEVDEEEEEEIKNLQNEITGEEELQCRAGELIVSLFKNHKEHISGFVELTSRQLISSCLDPHSTPKTQVLGLILVNGMIANLGNEFLADDDMQALGETVLRYIVSPYAIVRQVAADGLGSLAEHLGSGFEYFAQSSIQGIYVALRISKGADEVGIDFGMAHDCAVVALGKIIKHQSAYVNLGQHIAAWIDLLPLRFCAKEAKIQHEMLLDIIEAQPESVFGEKGERVARVLRVFAMVVNTRFSSALFAPRMKKIMEALVLNEKTNGIVREGILGLSSELQEKLKKALE